MAAWGLKRFGARRFPGSRFWGRTILFSGLIFLWAFSAAAFRDLTRADLKWIGARIFENECGGRRENLVTWNAGEDFASLGIGHFIWYPAGKGGPYRESFTGLVAYLQSRRVALPALLGQRSDRACPWPDRRTFLATVESPQVSELRRFLQDTVAEQVRFMVRRLNVALPGMLQAADPGRRPHIRRQFQRVARTPGGMFALVDYVNFKGEGTSVAERIAGQGWGLLQVLDEMDDLRGTIDPLAEFSRSAGRVLTRRAAADPRPRVRAQWLAGWLARVGRYAEPGR